MGKIHRIKKQFRNLVAQQPLPIGNYWLAKTVVVYTGKSYDGSFYIGQYSSYSHPYQALVKQLIKEYERG